MLMRFNVTIASLIWSITSLLFAVKNRKQRTCGCFFAVSIFGRQSFRGRIQLAGCFSLQITAKTATTPKVSQWARPQAVAINSMVRSDLLRFFEGHPVAAELCTGGSRSPR
jgi:hypothetical protein